MSDKSKARKCAEEIFEPIKWCATEDGALEREIQKAAVIIKKHITIAKEASE